MMSHQIEAFYQEVRGAFLLGTVALVACYCRHARPFVSILSWRCVRRDEFLLERSLP